MNGPGSLAELLPSLHVDALICGGIGGGAKTALAQAEIVLYGGGTGEADKAAERFVDGMLAYNLAVTCDRHGEAHAQGHTCGEHGCGSHSCGGSTSH